MSPNPRKPIASSLPYLKKLRTALGLVAFGLGVALAGLLILTLTPFGVSSTPLRAVDRYFLRARRSLTPDPAFSRKDTGALSLSRTAPRAGGDTARRQ